MFDIANTAFETQVPSESPASRAVQSTRTMQDIRRGNLRALVERYGGQGALARKLGLKKGAFISQVLSTPPVRPISEKTAAKWEKKLELPDGWMSRPPPTPLGVPIGGSFSERLVQEVVATLKEVNVDLPALQLTTFAIRLNSRIQESVLVTS